MILGLVDCCVNNSNAIVKNTEDIKNNSNAIISISTIVGTLPVNNSNAIIKLRSEMQTFDHGPEDVVINSATYTMLYDIYVSYDHLLQVQSSCVLDGNGHMIHFAKDSSNILQVADGCNVVLENVVLENFNDVSVQLGAGAALTFGDGCRVDLPNQQAMTIPWIFQGNTVVNGCGSLLELGAQSIQVMQGGNLILENLTIDGLADNNIRCVGNAAITFKQDILITSNDYSFTSGALRFKKDVILTGTNIFSYETNMSSTIESNSMLLVSGATLRYAPSVANRDLITMEDLTSVLYLNGCALSSSTTGLRLTNGTLTIADVNQFYNTGATTLSQAICFGNGVAADDLNINIIPGGQIVLEDGILDYQNVN